MQLYFVTKELSITSALSRRLKISLVILIIGIFIVQLLVGIQTNMLIILQAPVAVFVFIRIAFINKSEINRGLAVIFTRNVLFASGVLWIAYFLMFPYQDHPNASILSGEWGSFTAFNSYYDLVLQMLLAFGQVMLIMEHDHSDLSTAHRALKQQSLTDHLTGSFNRQALHEHNRKTDIDKGASVVVCDLDDLKTINDKYGHDEGDRLLKHFVTEVEKQLRVSDSIYRWGGDEFVVVLSESTRDDANNKMEHLVTQMNPIILADGSVYNIGFSFGISYSRQSDNIDSAITTADRRMYAHKESRKRR